MIKKYRVLLSDTERDHLHELIRRRSEKALPVKRALALLAADEHAEACTDEEIHRRYRLSIRTTERLRQRFVEEGLDVAIYGKKREPVREKVFDGEVEAHLVALRCSDPPEGFARWSLRLLADKMAELDYVEAISHESVRQVLKKTS